MVHRLKDELLYIIGMVPSDTRMNHTTRISLDENSSLTLDAAKRAKLSEMECLLKCHIKKRYNVYIRLNVCDGQ